MTLTQQSPDVSLCQQEVQSGQGSLWGKAPDTNGHSCEGQRSSKEYIFWTTANTSVGITGAQCRRRTLHALPRDDGCPKFLTLLFQQHDKRCEVVTDLEECWSISFNLMTQNSLDEDEDKHDNPRTIGNLTAFYFRQVTSVKGRVKWGRFAKTVRKSHRLKQNLLYSNSRSTELGLRKKVRRNSTWC